MKLKALDPKDLSENTYTIKSQIDDFTSETEILEKKLASIDATLKSALNSYDDISAVATRNQDAASLAKIIDSKFAIIERLTLERLNISAQLERYSRTKAEQLDKLEYTYFHVNVYENKFVDGENLKDSWKASIRNFVHTVNQALQDATLNVIAFLFVIIPYIIYFFILLFIVKYIWRGARYIWNK